MRRTRFTSLLALGILFATVLGGAHLATAQDQDAAAHPAIGTWTVESAPADVVTNFRTISLMADGTASIISTGQGEDPIAALGAWEPTGDTSANLTFNMVTNGPAYITIRASLEFAEDGASFSGGYTMEAVIDPAGGISGGEIGPGTLDGTRLVVEAPGTPSESFEDFFAIPDAEATPAP